MEKRYAQLSARQAAQRSLALADLLKNSRSVLLGDPGTGKTTITRYITYALATKDYTHLGDGVRGRTPLLIRIANYGQAFERDKTLHLIEYIETELTQQPETGRYLRQRLEDGQCLVILDGLDEVTNPNLRMQVTDRIQGLVAGFSANHFMVTSRIVGYDVSPMTREFKHATLKEMTGDDQARFIRLWYDAIKSEVSESTHAEGADDLIKALRDKPQIARMAANPLLLTIMVLMHWRGIKLPGQRVKVYENATDTLVEYWTAQRAVQTLDAQEIKAILAPIAHYILSSNVGGVIAHQDLLPLFYRGIIEQRGCSELQARQIGKEMLKDLNEQSGIFLERGRDANDQPVYGFLHQTFGEYLAALHLAQQVLGSIFNLDAYIHRSMWHESLLLLAGHLSLFSPGHTDTLLQDILKFPAPYEEVLQRNLLLAVDCLADDIQIKPALRDQILEKLADLLDNDIPEVLEAALARYKRLGMTRHRDNAVEILKRKLESLGDLEKIDIQKQFLLATALVNLGAGLLVYPILDALELKYYKEPERFDIADFMRLSFETRPQSAVQYFIEAQTKANLPYSYLSNNVAAEDLTRSMIGPVDMETVQNALGQGSLSHLLESLLELVDGEANKATLCWLIVLNSEQPLPDVLVSLTQPGNPANIRCLAAIRLLEQTQESVAISTLQELAQNQSDQAARAAQVLLEAGQANTFDRQLLHDTALTANNLNAPSAIEVLLQLGERDFALAAALHLLTICQPELYYSPSQRIKTVIEVLVGQGYTEIGLAAARLWALRSDYAYRLEACEALIDAGKIEVAIPLLQYIAYEHHDRIGQRACQRLVMLRELGQALPLLARVVRSNNAALRYHACLALALTDYQLSEPGSEDENYWMIKARLFNEHAAAYQDALNEFCQTGLRVLQAINLSTDEIRNVQVLAQLSLKWLAGSLSVSDQVDISQQFLEMSSPVFGLQVLRLSLQAGQVAQVQKFLMALSDQEIETITVPVQLELIVRLKQLTVEKALPVLIKLLSNRESEVRSSAVYALSNLGDSAAVQPLLTALRDTDADVRSSAAYALGDLNNSAAVQPLLTALGDTDANVRSSAAYALGNLDDSAAVQPLLIALGDTDANVRSSAAYALSDLGDSAAVQPLLTALGDTDVSVSHSAAYALGRLSDSVAVQSLLTALGNPDANLRSSAARALGNLDDSAAVQPLLIALGDADANVRSSAAYALGNLGDSVAVPPLVDALRDVEANVRRSAAYALGNLGDSVAVPPLVDALRDIEANVRSSAADVLGNLGDSAAVQPLLIALGDADANVRRSAAYALGRLGDSAAAQPLLTALSDADASVRRSAAYALGRLSDSVAVQPLLTALGDAEANVRRFAADALGRLGDLSSVWSITYALMDADPYVRSNAADALGRIGVLESASIIAVTSTTNDSFLASIYARTLSHLNPQGALKVLERYRRQFPNKSWVERMHGQALWRLAEYEAAFEALRRALEKEEDSDINLLALAHFHFEQESNQKVVNEYIDQALEKKPKSAICILSKAVIFWHRGETAKALEKLAQAQRLERTITHVKDLQYEHFWREKALATLEQILNSAKKSLP